MRIAVLACAAIVAALGEEDPAMQLLRIRRVYVEKLGGGGTADQFRDMLISSLQSAKLFVVTENAERADALLRGSAEDLVFTDTFQTSEGVDARGGFSTSSGEYQRSVSSSRQGVSGSIGVGVNESTRIAERKHEASAAVRLVSKEGDVIWSTTQESLGGKFRGASADVADRVVKHLVDEYARVKKKVSGRSGPPSGSTPPR
jgi:hypothetical protein